MSLNDLPSDVLVLLALDLNIEDVMNFCLANRRVNKYVCENTHFWRRRLEKDFPDVTLEQNDDPKEVYQIYKEFTSIYPGLKNILGFISNPEHLMKVSTYSPQSLVFFRALINSLDRKVQEKLYYDHEQQQTSYILPELDDDIEIAKELELFLTLHGLDRWDRIRYISCLLQELEQYKNNPNFTFDYSRFQRHGCGF